MSGSPFLENLSGEHVDHLLWLAGGKSDLAYRAALLLERQHHARVFKEIEHGPVVSFEKREVDAGPADAPDGSVIDGAGMHPFDRHIPLENAEAQGQSLRGEADVKHPVVEAIKQEYQEQGKPKDGQEASIAQRRPPDEQGEEQDRQQPEKIRGKAGFQHFFVKGWV